MGRFTGGGVGDERKKVNEYSRSRNSPPAFLRALASTLESSRPGGGAPGGPRPGKDVMGVRVQLLCVGGVIFFLSFSDYLELSYGYRTSYFYLHPRWHIKYKNGAHSLNFAPPSGSVCMFAHRQVTKRVARMEARSFCVIRYTSSL